MVNLRMVLLALVVVLVGSIPGYCSSSLSFYSSARPMGMGGAFTAVADDANAVFYNPAGLGFVKNSFNSASAGSLGQTVASASFSMFLNYDQMPFKLALSSSGIHDWTDLSADYAVHQDNYVFPFKVDDNLSVSIGYKQYIINSNFENVGGSVGSANVGMLYKAENGTRFGLFVDNILKNSFMMREPSGQLQEENYSASITCGVSHVFSGSKLLLAADISYLPTPEAMGNDFTLNIGCEYGLNDAIYIRSGYSTSNNDNEYGTPTFGFGLNLPAGWVVDMASALKRGTDAYLLTITWKG